MGFWEPHSSSVEFCEPNYLLTPFIAEPHNAWSSLCIFILALIGFNYGNPLKEFGVSMMFFALALVGLGSTALHTTLHWLWQSSDEIPMLWQALSMLYFLFELRSDIRNKRSFTNLLYFAIVCAIQTVMYFFFQKMFVIFVISVTLYAAIIVIWIAVLVTEDTSPIVRNMRFKLFNMAILSYAFIGAVVWIVDMYYCDLLLPFYLKSGLGGMTLHVLWHIGAGFGTYLAITFLILVRLQVLKKDVYLKWLGNIIPICLLGEQI
mmetsp:Transcript_30005/g.41218  ORF Transcript_30005/g.41218 Transcript_30005/m.41218 type:complete len:263 (-) Transcript_30005:251-1039(-)